jgi:hypothetical protein
MVLFRRLFLFIAEADPDAPATFAYWDVPCFPGVSESRLFSGSARAMSLGRLWGTDLVNEVALSNMQN